MVKVVTIVGARPQFIKAAVVSRAIAASDKITEVIIHTGQHFDPGMSDIFFNELQIPTPAYNLAIGGGTHGQNTGRMIEAIESILIKEKPDWVVVYGDTDSTLAGALAAKKLHIKLAHVEAGLRSYNMRMPEELNRILTDRISDILFCPTDTAISNLVKEGFENFPCRFIKTGDVMYDASLFYSNRAKQPSFSKSLDNRQFVLCTIHRAENTDNEKKLKEIFDALLRISTFVDIVVPVHPRTVKKIKEFGLKITSEKLHLVDPVGYLEMIWLLQHSQLVLTDSGGLQKEAYFFQKACVTLREETEWVELVKTGFNILAGTDSNLIFDSYIKLSETPFKEAPELYGDGHSAESMLKELI
jgi:UDP-GlcNAc3NAcA epimerase